MFTRRIMRAAGLACVLGVAAAILAIAVVESLRVASGATRVADATVSQVLDDDDWMRDVRAGRFFKKASPTPSSYTRNYQDEVSPYDRRSRSNLGRPPTLDELRPRRSTKPRVIRSSTTYRTLCVRECDGAFFPISTLTTRDRFSEDEATCKSQCGVPARLYVYKTIGGSIETMVDVKGRPCDKQPNAFLFRTKYVAACTCRAHPWEKASRERHAGYTTKEWQRKAKKVARLNRRKARKQRHKVRAMRRWLEKNGAAVAMGSVVTRPPNVRSVIRTAYRPRAARTTLPNAGGPKRGGARQKLRRGRMGLGAGKTRRQQQGQRKTKRSGSNRMSGWQRRILFGID